MKRLFGLSALSIMCIDAISWFLHGEKWHSNTVSFDYRLVSERSLSLSETLSPKVLSVISDQLLFKPNLLDDNLQNKGGSESL